MSSPPALEGHDLPSPIAITGASGYVASWITKLLLDAGVTVHATVRDPAREDKVGHLRRLAEGAPGELELFTADLLEPGSFDEAFAGCEVVMHTASPFALFGLDDPESVLVRPALEGTRNALASVERTSSVRRVVLTSSAAAIYGDADEIQSVPGRTFTEEVWNTSSSAEHMPYNYAKTIAEREAWKIHDAQARWSLVTINPSVAFGPQLSDRDDSNSSDTIRRYVDGRLRFGVPRWHHGVVDVRDVALAHLLAAAKPDASGRYILSAKTMAMIEIAQSLRRSFGKRYPLPSMQAPKPLVYLMGPLEGLSWRVVRHNIGFPIRFDTTRSRELGVTYRPVDDTLREHIEDLERRGLVQRA